MKAAVQWKTAIQLKASLSIIPEMKLKFSKSALQNTDHSLKVREFFQLHTEYDWFLDNGTLLAAYRDNGKMLDWDDDFDVGIVFPGYPTKPSLIQKDGRRDKLLNQLNKFLEGSAYKARAVKFNKENPNHDYAEKIEVYDPSYGTKPLRATNYHHVSLDIQFYSNVENDLVISLHVLEDHARYALSTLLPPTNLQYEGEWYPAPRDTLAYLTAKYGYLGNDCTYNETTKLYEKRKI